MCWFVCAQVCCDVPVLINSRESEFFPLSIGTDSTQVIRLGGKYLALLSHLTGCEVLLEKAASSPDAYSLPQTSCPALNPGLCCAVCTSACWLFDLGALCTHWPLGKVKMSCSLSTPCVIYCQLHLAGTTWFQFTLLASYECRWYCEMGEYPKPLFFFKRTEPLDDSTYYLYNGNYTSAGVFQGTFTHPDFLLLGFSFLFLRLYMLLAKKKYMEVKIKILGAGEMTHWLRVLGALSEDLGSILRTHIVSHRHV